MSQSDFHQPADRDEAQTGARLDAEVSGAEPGPVDDGDAQQAAEGLQVPPDVAASYEDMLERGAAQKGEGRVP